MKPLVDECTDRLVEHLGKTEQKPFDTKTYVVHLEYQVQIPTSYEAIETFMSVSCFNLLLAGLLDVIRWM